MRAIVVTEPGGPEVLELVELPIPEPGAGQIRVRVRASALNRADISQRLGRYPAPAGSPADIPGLEYSGEVDALGEGAEMWKAGDAVMGIVGGGAHAEFVVVHEREAMPMPPELTWEEAGAIPEVFLTAYDAIFRQLDVRAGETLLIHAAGSGVGTAAIQLASISGISTIGTSRSAEKLERARAMGLGTGVDTSELDWAERIIQASAGKGVDAILDLVGGDYFPHNLKLLNTLGRIIIVGVTAGTRSEIDLGLVMRKRIRIYGTGLRYRPIEEKTALAREFAARMIPCFSSRKLRPVLDSVGSFTDIRAAHQRMESNESFGKIVLRW